MSTVDNTTPTPQVQVEQSSAKQPKQEEKVEQVEPVLTEEQKAKKIEDDKKAKEAEDKTNKELTDQVSFLTRYMCCITIFIFVPLIIFGIWFFCYTIYSLFHDYTVAMECEESNLWLCILMTLIISALSGCIQENLRMSTPYKPQLVKYGIIGGIIIQICLCIWTFNEVFVNSPLCQELSESGLWIVGLIQFIFLVLGVIFNIYLYITIDTLDKVTQKLLSDSNKQPDEQPLLNKEEKQPELQVNTQSQVKQAEEDVEKQEKQKNK